MSLLGDIAVKLGLDVADFQKGLKDAEKNMKTVGKSISGVGTALTKSVTLPLLGVGVASIKIGADFEKSMSKVEAVTGASGKDFDALEKKARDLGSSTKYSANEVADSMGFLGMAGFETNEILDSTSDMLNLASISGLELAQTADITSNILSGMGMSADETNKLVDTMASTVANSNTDIAGLGEAMKYVAPIASDMNIDLDELSGAIGFLGDAGIKGGQAGTQLANGITRLSAPTKEASEEMEKLGIEAFDANDELKSLPDVLGEMEEGFKDLSPREKTEAMKKMFGQENIKGWSALIGKGSDELKVFSGELRNSEGAGQELADTMNDNLIGKLAGLQSALSDIAISIYKALEEPLKKVVEVATNVVRWLGNLDKSTLGFIVVLGIVIAIIPPLLVLIGGIVTMFGFLTGAIAGTMLPIIAIIGGLALLGVGFALLWKKSEKFRTIITSVFAQVKSFFLEVFNTITSFFKEKISEIKSFWDKNGADIQKAFEKVVGAIGKVFDIIFPIIKSIVMDVINSVIGIIDGFITFVLGFVKLVTGVINGDWAKAWEGFKQMVSGAVKSVWNFIKLTILGKVMKVFKGFGGLIGKALKNVGSKMMSPFKKGYKMVKGWIDKITDKVKNMFNTNIKKPSFSFSGSLNPVKWASQGLPKLGINWNAKGNIFNGASVLGGGQGVGESGAEAVLPIQHKRYMKPFSSSIAEHLDDTDDNSGKGDVQNTFNISQLVVREEADVERIAKELERIQRKEQRAKGVFAY